MVKLKRVSDPKVTNIVLVLLAVAFQSIALYHILGNYVFKVVTISCAMLAVIGLFYKFFGRRWLG